ncbi:MAG: hypothetical protein ISP91_16905 [Pseudomonadales bacterium]|jgi:hypothetical protein|nr:hypothetical protein [Pseudomonadales bacterium]
MTAIYALIGASLVLPLLFSNSENRESTLLAKVEDRNCARNVNEDEEF